MIQPVSPEAERDALYRVRPATPYDVPGIARLCAQLPYPNPEERIRVRLARLAQAEHTRIFVAVLPDEQVAGWIQISELELLVSEPGAVVAGLVIDEEHRKLGVGKHLMERAEAWARERGCRTVVVRSREHRKGAHEFYERLGYHVHKSQRAFRKLLAE